MDFPGRYPYDLRRLREGLSLPSRAEMESQVPVFVYRGVIGRCHRGVEFHPSVGEEPTMFTLQLSHRDTRLTLEALKGEVHRGALLGDRYTITNLIYRMPRGLPDGNVVFEALDLVDDSYVRAMCICVHTYRSVVTAAELMIRGRRIVDPISSQLTPFSVDKTLTAIFYNGEIVNETDGVKFVCPGGPKLCRLKCPCSLDQLKFKIRRKCTHRRPNLRAIYFRSPTEVSPGNITWSKMDINTESDVQEMFRKHEQHQRSGPIELYAEFGRTTAEIIAMLVPPADYETDYGTVRLNDV